MLKIAALCFMISLRWQVNVFGSNVRQPPLWAWACDSETAKRKKLALFSSTCITVRLCYQVDLWPFRGLSFLSYLGTQVEHCLHSSEQSEHDCYKPGDLAEEHNHTKQDLRTYRFTNYKNYKEIYGRLQILFNE